MLGDVHDGAVSSEGSQPQPLPPPSSSPDAGADAKAATVDSDPYLLLRQQEEGLHYGVSLGHWHASSKATDADDPTAIPSELYAKKQCRLPKVTWSVNEGDPRQAARRCHDAQEGGRPDADQKHDDPG